MNKLDDEKMIDTGMQIILAAGDCRNFVRKASDKILEKELESASTFIKEAEECLVKAHRLQTQILQQNTSGQVNIMFAHAQDTLMCSQSELWIVEFMLNYSKAYEQ